MKPSKIDVERGVMITSDAPRCLLDGAIMTAVTTFVIGWWGSEPVYTFTCPICGAEGGIA